MEITCIAIDDEPLAIDKLCNFISKIPYLKLLDTYISCIDAIPHINTLQPDIIFLDIEMSNMTGIELLEQVNISPYVIIISAYEQYALKGYELDVGDYILKPYSIQRLIKAVEKYRNANKPDIHTKTEEDFIFIKTDYKIVKVAVKEIQFIEGMSDYLSVNTTTGKILTLLRFKEMMELLPPSLFVRIHKSYVVNIASIASIEKHRIYIKDKILPISQTYRDGFYAKINHV